jgi:ABC-2 type transport system permease protein
MLGVECSLGQGGPLMQAYWTLTRRELAGFFLSITGYVVIAASAFLIGFSFIWLLSKLGSDPTPVPLTELFYNTWLFWVILLLTTPVITMRLFALEKSAGTYETLMTTPVSDFQVTAAKFTAAMFFYIVMWLPLPGCLLLLRYFTNQQAVFDPGTVGCTFLGVFLLGCVFVSFGCFASSLTRSQVTASIISLAFGFGLFLLGLLAEAVPSGGWKSQVLSFFALPNQMQDYTRGVVDTRSVVFCASVTIFFLLLTLRVIESRRWK